MIANETTIHQYSDEVNVSNYSQSYGIQLKKERIVGFQNVP